LWAVYATHSSFDAATHNGGLERKRPFIHHCPPPSRSVSPQIHETALALPSISHADLSIRRSFPGATKWCNYCPNVQKTHLRDLPVLEGKSTISLFSSLNRTVEGPKICAGEIQGRVREVDPVIAGDEGAFGARRLSLPLHSPSKRGTAEVPPPPELDGMPLVDFSRCTSYCCVIFR